MENADHWTCDRCGKEIHDMADVGYMGPLDRTDDTCDPFTTFEVVCYTCEGKPREEK